MVVWTGDRADAQPLSRVIPLIEERHEARQCTSPVKPNSHWLQTAREMGIYVGPTEAQTLQKTNSLASAAKP